MFLLRAAAIIDRGGGASSSSSSRALLRHATARAFSSGADFGDKTLTLGTNVDAAEDAPTSSPGGTARAFRASKTTTLLSRQQQRASSSSGAFSSPSSNLFHHHHHHSRRSFAADAARSLDAKPTTKLVPIPLAQTGEGLKEVEIVAWRVAVGDAVEEFGPLCDVQSDKAAVEITSRFSGTVERLCYSEGDMVEVGATLCELRVEVEEEEEGETESVSSSPSLSSSSSGPGSSTSSDSNSPHSVSLASPAVRRVARELGIADLSSVRGTGPGGRVLKEDVERAAASGGGNGAVASSSVSASLSSSSPTAPAAATAPKEAEKEAAAAPLPTNDNPNDVILPLRGYRRAMVSAMTSSLTVPHFHFMDEYPVDKLLEARKALANDPKIVLQGGRTVKLTLLPFVIKAISLTLASSDQHAIVNASLSESKDSLIIHADHNIGVAVDTPRGLVVPVVKRVQDLSVAEVAAELARLQSGLLEGGGSSGMLPESDLSGATLTVSNIGSLGGAWATPLVHPPQAAIVALGRVRPKLVVVENEAKKEEKEEGGGVRSGGRGKKNSGDKKATSPSPPPPSLSAVASLPMSWGADHRVVDGAGLAKFAADVGALLSEPARMLLHSR